MQSMKYFDVPIKKKIILYAASYQSTIKGFKEFIESTNEIEDKEKYLILIVGNVPQGYDLNLDHKLLGTLNSSEMVKAYSAADVTVVSSIEDNLPNIILESLSCGTPVVGFKVAGLIDVIKEGYNGFLADCFNTKELSDKIVEAINTEDIGNNSRNYALQNFSPEIHAKKMSKLYEELINKNSTTTNNPINLPSSFPELTNSKIKILESIIYEDTKLIHELKNNKWIKFSNKDTKGKIISLIKNFFKYAKNLLP